MPKKAYMYGVPYEMYEKYSIRRYGAHGTSHRYVSMAAAQYLNDSDLKMVTCHLGNGQLHQCRERRQMCGHQHGPHPGWPAC